MSTSSEEVVADVTSYGRIVCVFSVGLFMESIWTKILQAKGDMKTSMIAQIVGAVTNIVLDPLLIFPVFFQAVASGFKSSLLTVIRTVVLFVPLGFLFSRFDLNWFWLTFPVTDSLTSLLGFCFYRQFLAHPYVKNAPLLDKEHSKTVIAPSRPGVIITIARQTWIRRSDKARAAYYRHISGNRWGDEKNYELVIDSSCGMWETSEKILNFLQVSSNTENRY